MARYTRPELLDILNAMTEKEVVFKVEVDDLKYHVTRIYDEEKKVIGENFTHFGQWQKLSDAERAIDLPYTLAHLFGKKFLKSIDVAKAAHGGTTPYIDAVGQMVSNMSPIHTAMVNLVARQVKGRRPAEITRKVIGTRLQLRAVCPCCFHQQAISGICMVSHGYTVAYGTHNGVCHGYNEQHFGTKGGRDYTAEQAVRQRAFAQKCRVAADAVRARQHPIYDRKTHKEILMPTDYQIRAAAEEFLSEARAREAQATMYEKMVKDWKAADPIEVQVDIYEN